MRPLQTTPAHVSDQLAELVCSNSLGSNLIDRAPGLLKEELRRLGSMVTACADATAVPAGGALAVDREAFAQMVTERIVAHPRITLRREEVRAIPVGNPVVMATGPLTSPALSAAISTLTGSDHLYFYDAMAPIVTAESVNMEIAFRASRYDRGEGDGDYLNCPMTREEYDRFVAALLAAETIALRQFEAEDARFFEACLPVEVLAARGRKVAGLWPSQAGGLDRSAHRRAPLRRGPVATGQPGRQPVQPGRIPDEPQVGRARARLSPDSRPGRGRVCAFWADAPQHVHQRAVAAPPDDAVPRA